MIKLLVVDDEQGICDILKKTFSPIGFTVLTATDGQSAISCVKKEKPKLVFLDIRMFGMSGLEVLKEIKAIDKSIRVVMLTVMADEKTRLEAKRLGADDFITKPFMSEHLEEVARKEIAELLKERKIQKPKILVVDDDEDVRTHLTKIISRRFSCEVDKAADGREALEKLKNTKFDVMVLDIKMPGLSGIDVIREAVKFTPQTQILAISAYDSDEVATQALKQGAVDFLHKPHTPEGIGLKIKDILKKLGKYQPKKA